MPELPEVETIVRGLRNHLVGFTINSVDLQRKDLRFPIPKTLNKSISGKKIINIFYDTQSIKNIYFYQISIILEYLAGFILTILFL